MTDDSQQSDNLNSSLEQLQQDLDIANNNWKRALADFENFKKQKAKENQELVEFAREVVVARLLPTLDSLGQAFKHMPEVNGQEFEKQYQNWQVGAKGIVSQLDKTLAELGVSKIEALGKKFDPHFHEAIKEIETDETQVGVVLEEIQTGFRLNEKVIRPSQVAVGIKLNN